MHDELFDQLDKAIKAFLIIAEKSFDVISDSGQRYVKSGSCRLPRLLV